MAKHRRKKIQPDGPRRPRPGIPSPLSSSAAQFEAAVHKAGERAFYVLRLYVTGSSPRSVSAIENIRKLCEQNLAGRYELEIVDIYQQPILASDDQIIAAPTLIKKLPFPLRKVIGDLSNASRIMVGLDLHQRPH